MLRQWGLRTGIWLLLGGWVGAWLLFPWVALTAFRSLPSTELAGGVVGPVLTALHLYGAAAGPILALLARLLRRGVVLCALPLLLSALCLYSQFGVSAEMDEIRSRALGPAGIEELTARFNALHRRSVWIFYSVTAAAVALVALHARAEARQIHPRPGPPWTRNIAESGEIP